MIVLRWLFRLVVIAALGGVAIALAARVHDGPIGPFPGGALVSGTPVLEPIADWSFATDIEEIELQLESQTTSRTTWVLVHKGRAYVPASTQYPPGKTWHRKALEDGRATLRIGDKKYPVTLEKVEDANVLEAVREVAAKKYQPPPGGSEGVWLFSVTSRAVRD